MSPKLRTLLVLAVPILLADCATKRIALAELEPHTPHDVLGEVFRFTLTFNQGAAMGLSLGSYSRWVFTVVAFVAIGVLLVLLRRADTRDPWRVRALVLIVAGAIGNLVDRLRWDGGVVDFIDVGVGGWRFWTFNVADSAVTIGAILLALVLWFEKPAPERSA
jgi:signal peptidase II